MERGSSHWLLGGAIFLLLAGLGSWWWIRQAPPPAKSPEPEDIIPPSIVITEESLPAAAASGPAPGMRDIAGYAAPGGSDQTDVSLLARSAAAFLTLNKQAIERPLSANEEWSAALRGQRPGTARWFEDAAPVFDASGVIVDRHGTPVHFHAMGNQSWEIRSAGPDRRLYTKDDAVTAIGREKK